MWRSVCALIATMWCFLEVLIALSPLVGFGLPALAFVDRERPGDRLAITLAPRDTERPADD